MYTSLLFLHSLTRWFVLASLLYALYRGLRGWQQPIPFDGWDNTLRHSTATIAHIQLMIGYTLYFNSPVIQYFRDHANETDLPYEFRFFGLIHILLMTVAVVLITIGSAMAKRQQTDHGKFKTMAIWFLLGLIVILVAVPWPFSPLANRPYIRHF
ncbi:hypothetical protein [Parachryseolinea silvisoli]|uniref:hypothetical protein n=1 Tax=Parachryseolinea silvisoli TaxID=2873601 RepID=UPI002265B0AF|nr:hypothetical protein [Parachryseolinea silvisoli]MCD9015039.1 hypothetical protein [Parachryseolinea silvisoli]